MWWLVEGFGFGECESVVEDILTSEVSEESGCSVGGCIVIDMDVVDKSSGMNGFS